MFVKDELSFWQTQIRPGTKGVVLAIVVAVALLFLLKQWLDNIDAQMTVNCNSAEYSMSFVAEKKRQHFWTHTLTDNRRVSSPQEKQHPSR
jgi:hypothetical protein